MIDTSIVWMILQRYAPKRQWVSIAEIHTIIASHYAFDSKDLEVTASRFPKWKLNVRRALESKKKTGMVRGREK